MRYILLFLLLPAFGFAQTVQDTTAVKFPLSVIKTTGKRDTLTVLPYFVAQVDKATADISKITGTVNSLSAISSSQGIAITDLQTQLAGIQIVTPPVPRVIWDNAYTLTEADNGAVLYFPTTATVTCPPLFAGFKVKIIRTGSGASAVVTINGANSVYGYKRLTLQYADGDINYITNSQAILTGRISK